MDDPFPGSLVTVPRSIPVNRHVQIDLRPGMINKVPVCPPRTVMALIQTRGLR